jgi:hypothetical protein
VIRLLLIFAWVSAAHAEIAVRWVASDGGSNKPLVVVSGVSEATGLAALSVYADQGDLKADLSVPPMAGRYWNEPGRLYFEPLFPLERGVNYRAVFRPDGKAAPIVATFELPLQKAAPATVVTHVYPTAQLLPENLLKFYIHFSAPMSRGRIYDHIHLLDEEAKPWNCHSWKLTKSFGIAR